MGAKYTIGLDFGTNSVRHVLVNVQNGKEIAANVWNYSRGKEGVIVDKRNPNLARQHPKDYITGIEKTVTAALKEASHKKGFSPEQVIGIGVDTTGSTPLPVDKQGRPLAFAKEFAKNPNALAWLWKDHTAFAEAEEINTLVRKMKPQYLAKIGGSYSSEWFWAKILRCLRTDKKVFSAAYTWVEIADWIPAVLSGTEEPAIMKRGICAAGHKAMFHTDWGGYPESEFLKKLDPKLATLRKTLPGTAYTVRDTAGGLTKKWAKKLGLTEGIPVAVGAFDGHLGGIGSGIRPGILVKNIGTSTSDMMVAPLKKQLPDIPGLCGIVPGSITPDDFGLEAGQSGVGDIFNWFVAYLKPGGKEEGTHENLTRKAAKLKAGESGLLALDWHNANRTILADQRLTGLVAGLTLHTNPAELYRAWIEATAFGARVIMERFEEYGLKAKRIICCGGIAQKNPVFMQIYADVLGKTLEISKSSQTGALGSAIAGAVVAGENAGGYKSFPEAISKMTGVLKKNYKPVPANVKIYDRLFRMYKRLHDCFGTKEYAENQFVIMKELLALRDEVLSGGN